MTNLMRELFFLIVASCLLVTDAIAQKKDTIAYGLNLDEVQILRYPFYRC